MGGTEAGWEVILVGSPGRLLWAPVWVSFAVDGGLQAARADGRTYEAIMSPSAEGSSDLSMRVDPGVNDRLVQEITLAANTREVARTLADLRPPQNWQATT